MSWLRKLGERIIGRSSCCASKDGECCDPSRRTAGETKEAVRKNYAGLIRAKRAGSCCGSDGAAARVAGYTAEQLDGVPEDMSESVFACGNPVAFAEMRPGQVVLDIGSGAGLDVFLAARKVGPEGKVIGLDMTPEMIEAARENAERVGAANVEFRLGDAETMPVEDASCDWIISNCVINLAPDKDKVFAEAFRVLKPGGRLMVSDIVAHDLPPEVRQSAAAWAGCVGGALEEEDYLEKIRAAGFEGVEVVAKLTYDEETLKAFGGECCSPDCASDADADAELAEFAPGIAGHISSVRISAVRP